MRIDIDTYKEILDTLTRNKSRSFLTGFGIFWGVFMLVTLIGGGKGLKEMLSNNFEGFATNSAIVRLRCQVWTSLLPRCPNGEPLLSMERSV